MTHEEELKAIINSQMVTNSMLPRIPPEKVRDILWAMVDKMLCKDGEAEVQAMLQSEIDAINISLGSKASTSSVSGLSGTISSLASALAGKYNSPSGTTAQYIRGDGSLASFPAIPSGQVQSDWNATTGLSAILNKPTQASKVDVVSGSTVTGVIDVLGIQVATGAAITSLGGTVAEIKSKLNAVISGAKSNGWMASA